MRAPGPPKLPRPWRATAQRWAGMGESTRPPLRGHRPAVAGPSPLLVDELVALAVTRRAEADGGARGTAAFFTLKLRNRCDRSHTRTPREDDPSRRRLPPDGALVRPAGDAADRLVDHRVALGKGEAHEGARRSRRVGG